ncbi:MAG: cation diffusion facilitator family transporter [Dissulfurispiraceae bacterium]
MSHANSSLRAIIYALMANLGIAAAKGLAAWYTGSSAMIAEAIHSAADTANQILLLLGLREARLPVSIEHPLGHGKAIYFWSFIVAIMLFSMGGMFAMYEGLHKLLYPKMPQSPWVAMVVLVVSMLLEISSLRGALAEITKVQGKRSLTKWFKVSRQSELIVVVGEDIAAIVGLSLAMVAVLATILTANPLFDALGTIAIGFVLLLVAVAVGIEVKSLLIGESAEPETKASLLDFLSGRPEVDNVYNLITLQLGSDLMIAVKVRMHEDASAAKLLADINNVEAALKARFPMVRWIFFEPDVSD